MRATLYALFPDDRERNIALDIQRAIGTWNRSQSEEFQWPFIRMEERAMIPAWRTDGPMPPDVMLSLLRRIDWAYPALLVYRAVDEPRWNQVTLGLSAKPELGED